MARPCFYHADLSEQSDVVELSPSEHAHAMQSRRLGVDTEINLINGQGLRAHAVITQMSKRKSCAHIKSVTFVDKPKVSLSMAVAMPKGDRQKWLVDALTQLGVTTLIPMTTDFSIAQIKESQLDKLRRISLEACKQSQNPWALEVSESRSFADVLAFDAQMFYTNLDGLSWLDEKQTLATEPQALVFVGPEGGFSETELSALEGKEALAITLGEHILRTELAAIAAAALFKC